MLKTKLRRFGAMSGGWHGLKSTVPCRLAAKCGSISGAALGLRRRLLPPQARGSDIRALAQGLELQPDDILGNPFPARESAKTAVNARNNPLAVADRRHRGLDALCDDFRMLNQVDLGIDHARNEDHVVGEFMLLQRGVFVLAARVSELDGE